VGVDPVADAIGAACTGLVIVTTVGAIYQGGEAIYSGIAGLFGGGGSSSSKPLPPGPGQFSNLAATADQDAYLAGIASVISEIGNLYAAGTDIVAALEGLTHSSSGAGHGDSGQTVEEGCTATHACVKSAPPLPTVCQAYANDRCAAFGYGDPADGVSYSISAATQATELQINPWTDGHLYTPVTQVQPGTGPTDPTHGIGTKNGLVTSVGSLLGQIAAGSQQLNFNHVLQENERVGSCDSPEETGTVVAGNTPISYCDDFLGAGPGPNAAEDGSLLAQANAARDGELARLTGVSSADRPATVVGAYNVVTGDVAIGSSSKVLQACAEACAARNVGGELGDIRFTRAFRPNGTGAPYREIPVCATYCEPTYGRGAFPDPQTRFESDLP
jgi:hypothetical protein